MGPSDSEMVAFVKKLGPIDLAISQREGLLPGVMTAWAAMESEWGAAIPKDSQSGLVSNNLFGIKAGPTWQAQRRPFVVTGTHEYQGTSNAVAVKGAFRAYPSWEASAEGLVSLLKLEGVYHPALDHWKRKDIVGFLKAIAASGYSTASDYDQRIMNALRTLSNLKIT